MSPIRIYVETLYEALQKYGVQSQRAQAFERKGTLVLKFATCIRSTTRDRISPSTVWVSTRNLSRDLQICCPKNRRSKTHKDELEKMCMWNQILIGETTQTAQFFTLPGTVAGHLIATVNLCLRVRGAITPIAGLILTLGLLLCLSVLCALRPGPRPLVIEQGEAGLGLVGLFTPSCCPTSLFLQQALLVVGLLGRLARHHATGHAVVAVFGLLAGVVGGDAVGARAPAQIKALRRCSFQRRVLAHAAQDATLGQAPRVGVRAAHGRRLGHASGGLDPGGAPIVFRYFCFDTYSPGWQP